MRRGYPARSAYAAAAPSYHWSSGHPFWGIAPYSGCPSDRVNPKVQQRCLRPVDREFTGDVARLTEASLGHSPPYVAPKEDLQPDGVNGEQVEVNPEQCPESVGLELAALREGYVESIEDQPNSETGALQFRGTNPDQLVD